MEEIKIDKLVHGGQGLGTMDDGRKAFVWNALPGEVVRARIIKKKSSYVEAIAEGFITASNERISPEEENYLATSPWQMMTFEAENKYKKSIVEELFIHEKVQFPGIDAVSHDDRVWHYRNKMEYSFWGDEQGIHLALYRRGSHGKQIVQGSKLAMPAVDAAANEILAQLKKLQVRAGEMKTIVVRTTQNGHTAVSLFVKSKSFPKLTIPVGIKGLNVYYSDPKSPASVPTKLLQQSGNVQLEDSLLGYEFKYDVDSFFQVNIPVFEKALASIKSQCEGPLLIDMYAGVGSIGLSVAKGKVWLIEIGSSSVDMARKNAQDSLLDANVIETSTERATEYITNDRPIIFDPPRAGLHQKVVNACLTNLPPKIIYLSCNPATQARDLSMLQLKYKIQYFEIFNFFPRTPHIETLAVLTLKH